MLILLAFNIFPQNSFIVKDKQGNKILETDDINLIQRMKNIKVDTVKSNIHRLSINDSSSLDKIKDSILITLGKPKKSEYNYRLEWESEDNGIIILIKPRTFKPSFFVDNKGEKWVKEHFGNLIESIIK